MNVNPLSRQRRGTAPIPLRGQISRVLWNPIARSRIATGGDNCLSPLGELGTKLQVFSSLREATGNVRCGQSDLLLTLTFSMAAARQTRANWNKLIDDSDQPIWVVDAEGRIVATNPALRTWWGTESEQLVGQKIQFGTLADSSTHGDLAAALAPDPAVFTGRAVQTTIVHPLVPTQRLAVHWIPCADAEGEIQAAWAWGTRADLPEKGSPPQIPPSRITATTDWHGALGRASRLGCANRGKRS